MWDYYLTAIFGALSLVVTCFIVYLVWTGIQNSLQLRHLNKKFDKKYPWYEADIEDDIK